MNVARPSSSALDTEPQAPPTVTPLTQSSAEAYVASTCFKIGPPGQVGVELEWFVHDSCRPHAAPDPDRVNAALDSLRLSPISRFSRTARGSPANPAARSSSAPRRR